MSRAAAVLGLVLAGCQFDPTLPTGRLVRCQTQEDCPSDLVCRAGAQRCVTPGNPDRDAPALTRATVTPAAAKRGDVVRLTLTASEPLGEPPSALLVSARARTPFTLASEDGLTFTLARTVDDGDVEGPASVVVDLLDQAGNLGAGLLAGVVRLDFTAPRLVGAEALAPRRADGGVLSLRADEQAVVRVAFDEAPAGSAALTARSTCPAAPRFTPSGAEGALLDFTSQGPGSPGCEASLELGAVADDVGNLAAPAVVPLRLWFEADAPRLSALATARLVASQDVASEAFSHQSDFDTLVLRFTVDSSAATLDAQLDEAPLAGCDLSACGPADGGLSCRCVRRLSSTDVEGPHALTVTARGVAGTSRSATTTVRFDFTAPASVADSTQLQLVPRPGCPLGAVSALGPGGLARVLLAVDEPAAVTLVAVPEGLAFSTERSTDTFFAFTTGVDAGVASGARALRVTAVDAVGNRSTFDLQRALGVDTAAPAPPTGASLRRAPWGEPSSGPSFGVSAASGAEPGAVVVARGGPLPGATEVGRSTPSLDGGFALALLGDAVQGPWLAAVDSACNESASVEVKQVEWHATLAGKRAGSVFENPHRYFVTPDFQRALEQPAATEIAPAAVGALDTQAFASQGTSLWRPMHFGTTGIGGLNERASLSYDEARHRLLVVTQEEYPASGSLTWEWDGARWWLQQRGGPASSRQPALTYDSARQRSVLFDEAGQTWEWDGRAWALRSTSGPAGRWLGRMVYDSARRRAVLFGGVPATLPLDGNGLGDTWEWDGAQWRQVLVPGPPPRSAHGLAYDTARGVVVLHGGYANLTDTWEYDGGSWVQRASNGPAGSLSLGYDRGRARAVALSGSYLPGSSVGEWSGTAWTSRSTAPTQPLGLATYDPDRRALVLLATDAVSRNSGLWSYDGGAVVALDVIPELGIRGQAQYDPVRRRVVIAEQSVTHEWDGARLVTISNGALPAVYAFGLTFDPSRGRVVRFGGQNNSGLVLNELREWTGTAWQLVPATGAPQAAGLAMTYDAARQRLVAFSNGYGDGGVLEFDGGAWTQRGWAGPGPGPVTSGRAAYDTTRQRSLFVELDSPVRVWTWNGVGFTLIAPMPFTQFSLWNTVFDTTREQLLLATSDTLWGLGDGGLVRIASGGGAAWAGMAYDSARQRVVTQGNQVTEFGLHPAAVPAQLALVDFEAALPGPGDVVEGVTVAWAASGAGGDSAQPLPGVVPWVFDGVAFEPVDTWATDGGLALRSWTTTDGGALFVGPRKTVAVALTPRGANTETRPATLAVDAFELVVRYRRP